jgi:hypothetical protein
MLVVYWYASCEGLLVSMELLYRPEFGVCQGIPLSDNNAFVEWLAHDSRVDRCNLTVVKTSAVVAIDATDAALGPWVGSFMSILIAISVFGSGNGLIIYGGRFLVMTLLSSPFSGSLV